MQHYERLLIELEKENLRVKEIDFGICKECGFYCNNKILLNSRMSDEEKHGVLAEEVGHFFTSYGDITDQTNIANIKQEKIARRKGYELLLHPLDLVYAFKNGYKNNVDMAEYFGITIRKFEEILDDFIIKYGIGSKFGDYYINFVPSFKFFKIANCEYKDR